MSSQDNKVQLSSTPELTQQKIEELLDLLTVLIDRDIDKYPNGLLVKYNAQVNSTKYDLKIEYNKKIIID